MRPEFSEAAKSIIGGMPVSAQVWGFCQNSPVELIILDYILGNDVRSSLMKEAWYIECASQGIIDRFTAGMAWALPGITKKAITAWDVVNEKYK